MVTLAQLQALAGRVVTRGWGLLEGARALGDIPRRLWTDRAALRRTGRHAVQVGPHVLAAERRAGATVGTASAASAAALRAALDRAGIPYEFRAPSAHRPAFCVIAPDDWPTAAHALRTALDGYYATPLTPTSVTLPMHEVPLGRPELIHTLPSRATEGAAWRIGPVVARPGGVVVLGPAQAPIVLVGPLGVERPELEPMPWLSDVTFPVDVVYTWVDNTDPGWRTQYERAAQEAGDGPWAPAALSAARFTPHDELRYSLRSLEQFADWVRRIWIVSAGQVPAWLDVSHPKIAVVDHREIWNPEGRLPTFNSQAIEANLHRIDGLAEHFVYFNDDVLLGRSVGPEAFFRPTGEPLVFLAEQALGHGPPSTDDPAPVAAGKNNRRLVREAFGRIATHRFHHAPHALRRSILSEVEEQFQEDFTATSRSPFRSIHDIAPIALTHYCALASGRAVPGHIAVKYVDPSRRHAARQMRRILRLRDVDAFCVNAVDRTAPDPRRLRLFFERYFPAPSSFEMGPSTTGPAGDVR